MRDPVTAYVDRRVRTEGTSAKADIGMYYGRCRALDILETAAQGAPAGATTVPIFSDPPQLESGRIRSFRWTASSRGSKMPSDEGPVSHRPRTEFSDFLDKSSDVVRYLKNERLGFSVTYYENNRARAVLSGLRRARACARQRRRLDPRDAGRDTYQHGTETAGGGAMVRPHDPQRQRRLVRLSF